MKKTLLVAFLALFAIPSSSLLENHKYRKNSFTLGLTEHPGYYGNRNLHVSFNDIVTKTLSEFTLCQWSKLSEYSSLTLSYRLPFGLLAYSYGNGQIQLSADGQAVTTDQNAAADHWTHNCVTWSSVDGMVHVYQDGKLLAREVDFMSNALIVPGEKFFIEVKKSGFISEVQLWDQELSHHNIFLLSECEYPKEGNLFSWSKYYLYKPSESSLEIQQAHLCEFDDHQNSTTSYDDSYESERPYERRPSYSRRRPSRRRPSYHGTSKPYRRQYYYHTTTTSPSLYGTRPYFARGDGYWESHTTERPYNYGGTTRWWNYHNGTTENYNYNGTTENYNNVTKLK